MSVSKNNKKSKLAGFYRGIVTDIQIGSLPIVR